MEVELLTTKNFHPSFSQNQVKLKVEVLHLDQPLLDQLEIQKLSLNNFKRSSRPEELEV